MIRLRQGSGGRALRGSAGSVFAAPIRRSGAVAREGGFTLIEVLVALVVAVAAMSLLSQGFATGARASVGAQNATRAALLGQRVITDFEAGVLPATSNQSGGFDDEPDFSYETRTRAAEITGLVELSVTVKWKEREQERTYVLVRLMRDGTTTTQNP